jgi:hypothetical protein
MRVCLGDTLPTADGHEAGTVEWMLVDPATLRLNAVVIRRGLILRHSLVVPVADLDVRERDGSAELIVRRTRAELETLPEFRRELFTGELLWRLTGERAGPFYLPGWLPPASLEGPPTPSPEVVELGEIVRTIDQANAVLHRGAVVVTAEGERVGHLHQLCAALPTGAIATVRIRHGLPPRDIDLPVSALASADDGLLALRWWRSEFDQYVR